MCDAVDILRSGRQKGSAARRKMMVPNSPTARSSAKAAQESDRIRHPSLKGRALEINVPKIAIDDETADNFAKAILDMAKARL